MPPRARTAKPPAEARPPARHAKTDGEICQQCWPDGWRETSTSAACPHGTWTR